MEPWTELWQTLGLVAPSGLREALLARYAEPHRAYHTGQHLGECLALLDWAAPPPRVRAEVGLALWFHDAVYDSQRHDNEAQSAAWAVAALGGAGASDPLCARIEALILATKHDAVPTDDEAKLLVDIDLAILGADEARFAEYERQIRREYAWVPEEAFRAARARVLASFADRPAIYATPRFHERFEVAARRNLARALA